MEYLEDRNSGCKAKLFTTEVALWLFSQSQHPMLKVTLDNILSS